MGYELLVPPTDEPISLADARRNCSLDDDGDSPPSHPLDPLIERCIRGARADREKYTGLALAPQTWILALDSFVAARVNPLTGLTTWPSTSAIELLPSPIISIESITYVDADGETVTLDSSLYVLDSHQSTGWVLPAYGTTWPATYAVANAVTIRYLCGYSIPGDSPEVKPIPPDLLDAIYLLMTDAVINRTGSPSDDALRAADNKCDLHMVRMLV